MMNIFKTLVASAALAVTAGSAFAATVDNVIVVDNFKSPMAAGDNTLGSAKADPFESFSVDPLEYTALSYTADTALLSKTLFTINPYNTDDQGNPANSIAIFYAINGGAETQLAVTAGTVEFQVEGQTLTGTVGYGGVSNILAKDDTLEFRVRGFAGQSGNLVTFTITTEPLSAVPVPAAGFLMVGALGAMGVIRRKKKNS